MKLKLISVLCALFCISPLGACTKGNSTSQEEGPKDDKAKTLVVYFSCTNITKGIADRIANILSAAEFRIEPVQPYTAADLNYNDRNCRANQEQSNDAARPAISNSIADITAYDIVYVGFPIWWGKMPKIMFTFFDAYDLGGKTIIPFCTSGSSGIGTAMSEIRTLEPKATVKEGRRFSGRESEDTVKSWLEAIGSN